MSYILKITDYLYNSICIFTNNIHNYFYQPIKNEDINNNTDDNIISPPAAITEEDINISYNSDDEPNNKSMNDNS